MLNIKQQLVTPAWKWLLPLLLVVAGTAVYSSSFSGVFLFDDFSAIVRNLDVRHLFPWKMKWRCLTDLTFKITYVAGGWNPAYYHAGNIMIHVLAGLALYGVVRRALLLPSMCRDFGRVAPWLAFITAGIWVVHPLQTASVSYICQRYESMMGLFFLLTLYCFIRGVDPDARHPRFWSDMAIVSCVLGMGTKEVMAMAPVILFLFDYFFVAGSFREAFRVRRSLHLALFCTLGILFVLILRTKFDHEVTGSEMFTRMSPWTYLCTQAAVVAHYVRLAFVPDSLCFDYSWPPAENLAAVIRPALFMTGVLLLTIWFMLRRIAIGFPLAWFFIILAPTSSFMPLGDMAFEHRMYLSLAGIIVLSVTCGYWVICRISRNRILVERFVGYAGVIVALAIFFLFSALTVNRNKLYWSAEAIWRDAAEKRPENLRAFENLTMELLNMGKIEEAERVLRVLLQKLDVGGVRAEGSYVIKPSILMHYQSAAHDRLGITLLYSDKTEEAIRHFTEALRISQNDGYARHNLGLALLMSGRTNQALAELGSIQVGAEGFNKSQGLIALILSKQGDFPHAIQCYRKAIECDPTFLSAKCELAWLLSASPADNVRNGREALKLALEVADATLYASYHALDVLAAAYAENGRFGEAVKHARKAGLIVARSRREGGSDNCRKSEGLIKDDMSVDEVKEIEKRIGLYEQRRPYRIGL